MWRRTRPSLKSFADAYKRAERKCDGEEAPPTQARCRGDLRELRDAVEEELKLHSGYAKKWGADLGKDFKPLKATIDYTSFLEKISRDPTASAAEVVAAMVPCMTLYAILGKRLEKAGIEDDNPYREWVETYSSDEFWEAKEQAEGLLDVLTPHGCEDAGTYTPRPCASSILFLPRKTSRRTGSALPLHFGRGSRRA